MSRYKAFAIHLGISALIFAVLAAIIVLIWYPGMLFQTDGGWQGIRLVAGVDFIIGPVLTLIVYKAGKPGLKFDLTLIGIVQALCLTAGTYIVYAERPLAVVYSDGMFNSMSAQAYISEGLDVPDFSRFKGWGPKWVTVDLPDDPHEQSDIRMSALQMRVPLYALAERYIPFDPSHLQTKHAVSHDMVQQLDTDFQNIPDWIARNGGSISDYDFYYFGTRYEYTFIGVRRADKQVIGLLGTPIPAH